MSKAAELAALIGSQTALSNRNLIINGNFDVWQRGTSGFTGSEYIADRWRQNLSGATATSSQQSFTIGQTSVPNNPEYYVNMNCTTGNNNAGLQQRIENPKRLSNTTITISFWAKGTNPSGGSFDLDVYAYDGSGLHFPTNRQQPFTVTSGWQKFVKSVTLSDLSGETVTSSGYTLIGFTQPDGDTGTAAWSLDLAQVQVELGEQATPFEHESFAATLQKCERYYNRIYDIWCDFAVYTGGGRISRRVDFPTTMRANPAITRNTVATSGCSGVTSNRTNLHGTHIFANSTGATTDAYFVINNMEADAEL